MMLLLAALWGSSYLFIKIGIEDGARRPSSRSRASPSAPWCSFRSQRTAARCADCGHGRGVVHSPRCGCSPYGPFLLITIGERWISSSLAGILVASAPIFIVFLALWGDSDERSAGRQLVGVGTGMAGVALLLGIDVGTGGLELIGASFVLLASFARSRRARAQAPPRRGAASSGWPPVPCPPGPPTAAAGGRDLPDLGAVTRRYRRAGRARGRRHWARVPVLLHAHRRGRGGAGVGRCLPGPGSAVFRRHGARRARNPWRSSGSRSCSAARGCIPPAPAPGTPEPVPAAVRSGAR